MAGGPPAVRPARHTRLPPASVAGCRHGVAHAAQQLGRRRPPGRRRPAGRVWGRFRGASRRRRRCARSPRRMARVPAHTRSGARSGPACAARRSSKLGSPKTQGVCFAAPQDTALFLDAARGRYLRSGDGDLVRTRLILCGCAFSGRCRRLMRGAPSAVALSSRQRRRHRGAAAAEGAAGRGRRGCRAGACSRAAAAAAALAASQRSPLISTPPFAAACR